jgi:hypothetical protein
VEFGHAVLCGPLDLRWGPRNTYSDLDVSVAQLGSSSGRSKAVLSSPYRPDRVWGHPASCPVGTRGSVPGFKAALRHQLAPRLGMVELCLHSLTHLHDKLRGLSSWLQIQRCGFDSLRYQIFWEVVALERAHSLVSAIEELLGRRVATAV